MYRSELTKQKILVVEDNKINQLLIGKHLKNLGISPDYAQNGLVGIDKALSKKYDLIMMDLFMPKLDGFEATRRLRDMADPYFEALPIIALTASEGLNDYQHAFQAGVTAYLLKPVSAAALYRCLYQHLLLPAKQEPARLRA